MISPHKLAPAPGGQLDESRRPVGAGPNRCLVCGQDIGPRDLFLRLIDVAVHLNCRLEDGDRRNGRNNGT